MDQYSDHINHIVQKSKTSPRTCLLVQDVLDVRKVNIVADHSTWQKLIALIPVKYKRVMLGMFSN